MSYILETKNLTMRFGGLVAVSDLNLKIEEGQIVALIGPNGAGKTTSFNMITGINEPSEGEVLFCGQKLNGKKPEQIAKLGISRTFQNIRLFKTMSVFNNVLVANHVHTKCNIFTAALKLRKARKEEAEMKKKTHEVLEATGLLQYSDWQATSLPYGLQRRLEIARALVSDPKLLLLDEPAAGMNPKESDDLAEFIKEIRDKFHVTIFLIEHHMKLVMKISEKIYVEQFGKTIAVGTPTEIQKNADVINAYLGEEEKNA